jgi:DNA-binding transcriptional LysR family regulator
MLHILHDPFGRIHMGVTAENVAGRFGITREQMDALAEESHRCAAAIAAGRFKDQIAPVQIVTRKSTVNFEVDEHVIQVHGQCIFNTTPQMLIAARAGFGLANAPEDLIQEDIAAGRLQAVLEPYWPTWPGYHLYFPSRRQASPAFALVVEALRWRPER